MEKKGAPDVISRLPSAALCPVIDLGQLPHHYKGMPPDTNLEIKARCRSLASLRSRVEPLATEYVGMDHQIDTYFNTRQGRLKLRESALSGAQLIPYLRADGVGPKRSDYRLIPIQDAEGVKQLLTALLGVHRVVRKEREIFLYENVRIHLDRVEGLGEFLELEAVFSGAPQAEQGEHTRIEDLMKALEISRDDLLETSYEALLEETGQ
ncbi:MAG: class IV adenylate cyclase [Planctomycetota bacterium]